MIQTLLVLVPISGGSVLQPTGLDLNPVATMWLGIAFVAIVFLSAAPSVVVNRLKHSRAREEKAALINFEKLKDIFRVAARCRF